MADLSIYKPGASVSLGDVMRGNEEKNFQRRMQLEKLGMAQQKLEQDKLVAGKPTANMRDAEKLFALRQASQAVNKLPDADPNKALATMELKAMEDAMWRGTGKGGIVGGLTGADYNKALRQQMYSGQAGTSYAKQDIDPTTENLKIQAELAGKMGRGIGGAPVTVGDVKTEEVLGGKLGEAKHAYKEFASQVPTLERAAGRLNSLVDAATYTLAGQARDKFIREFNFDPGDNAAALAEYENIVKVTILPTLKATFGGQMSIEEGKWLLSTLGDPSLHPREKKAQIAARVSGWRDMARAKAEVADVEDPETFRGYDEYGYPQQQTPQQQIEPAKQEEMYFNLRKQNFTDEQIKEYAKMKGINVK